MNMMAMKFSRVLHYAPSALLAVTGALGQGMYSTSASGEEGTLGYRVFTQADGQAVSAWHDVPLYTADGYLNFMCEIPANTTAKFELQTEESGNPIAQDVKNGLPRNYAVPIMWNYGMLPRTWEDPDYQIAALGGAGGDNDPTDVVEIGAPACTSGQVYEVKPICAFAMLDDGEVDWKVIVVPADSPNAAAINGAADADAVYPGELEAILEWFKFYKTVKNVDGELQPSGDPPAEFGFDEACVDGEQLVNVLNTTSSLYQALVSGQRENTEDKALP